MRTLMTVLIFASVFAVVSAITGIQGFRADTRTGTVIWYWHGYGRLYALGYAAAFAAAFYGVYRRYPLTWKLGWVAIYLSSAQFAFEAWRSLGLQPYGWLGASFATLAAIAIALYWSSWWHRQKPYFFDLDDEPT